MLGALGNPPLPTPWARLATRGPTDHPVAKTVPNVAHLTIVFAEQVQFTVPQSKTVHLARFCPTMCGSEASMIQVRLRDDEFSSRNPSTCGVHVFVGDAKVL